MVSPEDRAELSRSTVVNRDCRELDLLDVIEFVWAARLSIVGGVVAGLLFAIGIWFVKERESNRPGGVTSTLWSVHLGPNKGDDGTFAALPQQLISFIKTPEGARAFYTSLAMAAKRPDSDVDELVNKQITDQGIVKGIEISGSHLVVTLETSPLFSDSEIRMYLSEALNQTIHEFNENYVIVQERLFDEAQDVQLKLAELKIAALRLFEQYSELSASSQKTMLEGLIKDIVTSANMPLESLLFVFAAIPGKDREKKELLNEYRKQSLAKELLHRRGRLLAKTLGLETITPMLALGPVVRWTAVNTPMKVQIVGSQSTMSLRLVLILGAVIGGIMGTFVSVLRVFWTTNYQRLTAIFSNNKRL